MAVATPPEKVGRQRKEKAETPAPEPPPFKPTVTKINAIAKRTVKTGQYEMYEISTMVEAEPDPNHTVQHNISMINQLVSQEVNAMAEEIRKSVEVQQ